MLTRVRISNYKSIASCDVSLGLLNFLVGLNGAGKSNFVDALRFCRDALRGPLDQAFRLRTSNVHTLTHVANRATPGFAIALDLTLFDSGSAHYAFATGSQTPRGFSVKREECVIRDPSGRVHSYFAVTSGIVRGLNFEARPAPLDDRLYLVNASGSGAFRLVYDALEGMEFYDPDPEEVRTLDSSAVSEILESTGTNLASVLRRIYKENPAASDRIQHYLQTILPGLLRVGTQTVESYKFVRFEQELHTGNEHIFSAGEMSDGTLRALAILVALFQRSAIGSKPTLVVIEEPETGLHPAAAGVLFDALKEASLLGQVLVTSHSPDLLDNPAVPTDSILAVEALEGSTTIAPLNEAGRSTLQDRLYTAGELLRMDQLKPSQNNNGDMQPASLFEAPAL
jgi:predicted ATPase